MIEAAWKRKTAAILINKLRVLDFQAALLAQALLRYGISSRKRLRLYPQNAVLPIFRLP